MNSDLQMYIERLPGSFNTALNQLSLPDTFGGSEMRQRVVLGYGKRSDARCVDKQVVEIEHFVLASRNRENPTRSC